MAARDRIDRISAVDRGFVPEEEEVAAQVAQQMAHERADLGMPNVFGVQVVVEAEPVPLGADRDRGTATCWRLLQARNR